MLFNHPKFVLAKLLDVERTRMFWIHECLSVTNKGIYFNILFGSVRRSCIVSMYREKRLRLNLVSSPDRSARPFLIIMFTFSFPGTCKFATESTVGL